MGSLDVKLRQRVILNVIIPVFDISELDDGISIVGYFIFVLGGYFPGGCYDNDVELVSIYGNPVPDCLEQLSDIPVFLGDAAAALDYSGKLILCRNSHTI